MKYTELISLLQKTAETEFADFQRRLIFTSYEILGVRTPKLREIAKLFKEDIESLLSFPNDYYEVVFIKLSAVALLPYGEFVKRVQTVVPFIDNWALCDSFRPKSLKKHTDDYLPTLLSFWEKEGEYEKRYALVTLLVYYMDEKYLWLIAKMLRRTDTACYYVHMAAAWLVAELLVKYYDFGVALLKEGFLEVKTHNKAIQKARESYRLSEEQKAYLNALKIKGIKR